MEWDISGFPLTQEWRIGVPAGDGRRCGCVCVKGWCVVGDKICRRGGMRASVDDLRADMDFRFGVVIGLTVAVLRLMAATVVGCLGLLCLVGFVVLFN